MESSQRFRRVAFLGSPGPVLLAFARTCKSLGISTYLIEVTERKSIWANYSNSITAVVTISPKVIETTEGVSALARIVGSIDADALIAVDDGYLLWLSQHSDAFTPSCRLLMPSHACLSRLGSKIEQIRLARKAGFELLPTTHLNCVADADLVPQENYPICLRPSEPTDVAPSFKVKVVHSLPELRSFLAVREIHKPIVAQPFLECPNLIVKGARSEDGQILAMEPFLAERMFGGVTLTMMRADFPPGVLDCCKRFAELAALTGGFHFELLHAKQRNKAFYLEVNVRMGGVTDKAKSFGYDEPRMFLESYGHATPSVSSLRGTSRRRVVTKRAVVKHLIKASTGQLTELDYPPVGIARHIFLSLRDLLLARDSVFDPRDLRGTLWYNLQRP